MIPKPLNDITKADIDFLVEQATSEGRTLDYKLTLPGNSDKDKVSFLADVSAFANAGGGDILYGVCEDEKRSGIPKSAPGLSIIDIDEVERKLLQVAASNIDPPIPNLRFAGIQGFAKGLVILLRIPKSFMAPHAVVESGDYPPRFYVRNNSRIDIMDVPQIRSAFLMSESLSDRMQKFQRDRLARIISGETPIPLPEGVKLVMHVMPSTAFDPTNQVDITRVATNKLNNMRFRLPFSKWGYSNRYNLDGYLTFDRVDYVQVFRKGIVESVGSYITVDENTDKNLLSGTYIEEGIICALVNYLDCLKSLSVEPPISLMLALLNVKDKFFVNSYSQPPARIDRDLMILPELTIQDINTSELDTLLKPTLDILWQSCGYSQSPNYDENGRHKSK